MSWNRTVYCRRCGGRGHNKRGCPELTPERKKMLYGNIERLCKWCGEKGHNSRSCKVKEHAKKEYIKDNKTYRIGVMEKMCDLGLGVGALVHFSSWDDNYRTRDFYDGRGIYLISKVEWNNICLTARVKKSWYKNGKSSRELWASERSPVFTKALCDDDSYYDTAISTAQLFDPTVVKILKGMPSEMVRSSVPEDYLEGCISEYNKEIFS